MPAAHFDADRCGHDLLESDPAVRESVSRQFGAESFGPAGAPNRVFLREAVFTDAVRRQQLEAILHPAIRARWMALAETANKTGDWLFVDIPLLFETGAESCFDHIVAVACSPENQLRRLVESRGMTADMAAKIISTQIDLQTKMSKAGHLIWNDSTLICLEGQTALFANWLRQSHA